MEKASNKAELDFGALHKAAFAEEINLVSEGGEATGIELSMADGSVEEYALPEVSCPPSQEDSNE